MLHKFDAFLVAIHLVVLRHSQFVGSNEVEGRIEVAHSRQEAVNRPAILEVTNQIDVEVLERSLRLIDGIEVEHRLAGMLIGSIACIDDGHRRHLAGILGCTLQIMTHHDNVGIIRHHHNRVLQGLALRAACHLWVGKANDFCAKTIGCSLEAETRASAWFEEQCGNYSSLEKTTVGVLLKLLCHTDQIFNLLARMVGNGYKASNLHHFTVFLCKDSKKFIVHSA